MNISKAQKKIIKDNYKELTLKELAVKTDLSEETVLKYLKKFGKSPIKKTDKGEIVSTHNEVEEITYSIKLLIRDNLEVFLLIGFVGLLLYFRTFFATFVSADDLNGFIHNPEILDFDGAMQSLKIHSIYYAVVMKFFGANALLMHSVSLALHILISCCVFILLLLLFGRKTALFSTLLFLTHPVNTEVVAWVSGVGYLLNGIFAFPMLIFYVLYKKANNAKYFWISLAIYAAALLLIRLPWTITAFAILVVLDQFILEKKINFKSLGKLWPYYVATGIWTISYLAPGLNDRVTNLSSNFGLHPETAEPLINRLPFTIYMMLKLYIAPLVLSIFHEGIGISTVLYIVMILATAVFFGWLIFMWKKNRVYAGLGFCLICSILPTLSPIQVAFFIAERYMYLGTAFFTTLIVLIAINIENRYKAKDLAKTILIGIILIYSLRTFIRVNDWKDSKNLWLATSKVEGASARVFNNLGDAFANENNYENSIAAFKRAIEIQPNYADAIHNLGNTYLQAGQLDLAEEYLMKSWEINPALYQATYKLGVIAYQRGDFPQAIAYFNKTIELHPGDAEAMQAVQIVQSKMTQMSQ